MPPFSIFARLGRAITAGIREFQNQEAAPENRHAPSSTYILCSHGDKESRFRELLQIEARPPVPLEGIEGRDKWLRENLPSDVAERVITTLGSDPNSDFNSIDALMTLSTRFVGEVKDPDKPLTEAEQSGIYETKLGEKFVGKVGLEDGGQVTGPARRAARIQSRDIMARAIGFCCHVPYEQPLYRRRLSPEEWRCCEKEPPADWELEWVREQSEKELARLDATGSIF